MKKLIDIIPTGKTNAISRAELSIRTGLSLREVDRVVFEARKNGVVICSSGKGYFIPRTAAEALAYYAAQHSRIKSGNIALRPVRDFIKREGARQQWDELERMEKEM